MFQIGFFLNFTVRVIFMSRISSNSAYSVFNNLLLLRKNDIKLKQPTIESKIHKYHTTYYEIQFLLLKLKNISNLIRMLVHR